MFSGSGRVVATVTFGFDPDGRITTIHNVANLDNSEPSPMAPLTTSGRIER